MVFRSAGALPARLQKTTGLCAIKVTDRHGQRISFTTASLRWLAKRVSAIPFGLGFLIVAVTEKHQALHDLLNHSQVLNRSAR